MQKITPCLCSTGQAEEAAQFYTKIFKRSKDLSVSRYGEGAPSEGTALVVVLRIEGRPSRRSTAGRSNKSPPRSPSASTARIRRRVERLWDQLRDPVYPGSAGAGRPLRVSWQIVPGSG